MTGQQHDDDFVGRLIVGLRGIGREIRVFADDRPPVTPLRRKRRPKVAALRLLRAGSLSWGQS